MSEALPCIICDKPLTNVALTDIVNQPNDAVVFIATGVYGSGVFDPVMSECWLEINICDGCVVAKSKAVLIGREGARHPSRYRAQYHPWNPETERLGL